MCIVSCVEVADIYHGSTPEVELVHREVNIFVDVTHAVEKWDQILMVFNKVVSRQGWRYVSEDLAE